MIRSWSALLFVAPVLLLGLGCDERRKKQILEIMAVPDVSQKNASAPVILYAGPGTQTANTQGVTNTELTVDQQNGVAAGTVDGVVAGDGLTVVFGSWPTFFALPASTFTVTQQAGDPNQADATITLFLEVTFDDGVRGYNQTPLTFSDTIDQVPPNFSNINVNGSLPLFSQPTGGTFIGRSLQDSSMSAISSTATVASGDFSLGAVWDNGVPDSTLYALIEEGHILTATTTPINSRILAVGGSLRLDAGGTAGMISVDGTLTLEDGAAPLTTNILALDTGSTLDIGGEAGSIDLTLTGSIIAREGSVMRFNVNADGDNDRLDVTGRVMLGGSIELNRNPTYFPEVGQQYTLLTAAEMIGAIDEVLSADIGNGTQFEVSINGNEVIVTVAPAPVQPVLAFGIDHVALGDAVLTKLGSALQVSHIGASGEDGVLTLVGGGEAFGVRTALVDTFFNAVGSTVRYTGRGRVSGIPNVDYGHLQLTKTASDTLTVTGDMTAASVIPVLTQRLQVLSGGTHVASYDVPVTGQLAVVLPGQALLEGLTTQIVEGRAIFGADFDQPVTIAPQGGSPAVGDQFIVQVMPVDNYGNMNFIEGVSLTGAYLDVGFTISDQSVLSAELLETRAHPGAVLETHRGQIGVSPGLPAQRAGLNISALDTFNTLRSGAKRVEAAFTSDQFWGDQLDVEADVLLGDQSRVSTGSLQWVADDPQNFKIRFPIGGSFPPETARLRVLHNGNLIGEAAPATGGVFGSLTAGPGGMPALRSAAVEVIDAAKPTFEVKFTGPIVFTPEIVGEAMTGNTLQAVLTAQQSVFQVANFSLSLDDDIAPIIVSARNRPLTSVPDVFGFGHARLGSSLLDLEDGDHHYNDSDLDDDEPNDDTLRIWNNGAAGNGGVTVDVKDKGTEATGWKARVSTGDLKSSPGSSLFIGAGGKIGGVARFLGLAGISNNGSPDLQVIADFNNALGATQVRVEVRNNGSTVGTPTTHANGAVGTIPNTPEFEVVEVGTLPISGWGYRIQFSEPVTFTPAAGGAPITGDEIRFTPVDPAMGPIESVSNIDIYAVNTEFTIAGEMVREPLVGDFDEDGDVDDDDVQAFESARTGPRIPITNPDHTRFDLDGDGDIDQEDFGTLQPHIARKQ